jgi:hypothetical protein
MVTAVAFSALLILTVAATRLITRLSAQHAESIGLHSYGTPPTGRNILGKLLDNHLPDDPPAPEHSPPGPVAEPESSAAPRPETAGATPHSQRLPHTDGHVAPPHRLVADCPRR